MRFIFSIVPIFALGLLLGISQVASAQSDAPLYGRDLMTEQERAEHREKLRSLETVEEREAYRVQHHEAMQARAQEQGRELGPPPQREQIQAEERQRQLEQQRAAEESAEAEGNGSRNEATGRRGQAPDVSASGEELGFWGRMRRSLGLGDSTSSAKGDQDRDQTRDRDRVQSPQRGGRDGGGRGR